MRVGFVRIFVSDVQRSLPFYTGVLGMTLDYTDGKGWAQFRSGEEFSLAIEACPPGNEVRGSRLVGRFTGVTLMVDSIAEAYARLTALGVEFEGAPQKQHWGGTLAHLRDPDGNVLTLLEEPR